MNDHLAALNEIESRLRDLEIRMASLQTQVQQLSVDVTRATNGYIRLLKALIPVASLVTGILVQILNSAVK